MIPEFPELRGNLERASKAPVPWDPWDGWSCNLARRLRKVYGWYQAKNKPQAKPPAAPTGWKRRSTAQSMQIGQLSMARWLQKPHHSQTVDLKSWRTAHDCFEPQLLAV